MSNSKIAYEWPSDFPDGLPENQDVVPAEGIVYRLVRTIPPTDLDFQRHCDEKPEYSYTSEQKLLSYGVSVWSKLDKLQRKMRNFPAPEQYGNWKVAVGGLVPELGVVHKNIPSNGHITLWLQLGAAPHNYVKDEVKGL